MKRGAPHARAAKAAKKAAADGTTAAATTTDKATKKADKMADNSGLKDDKMSKSKSSMGKMKEEKATPADYKAPVDPSQKGPNGEKVMTGPRGGKYYINKNGNKTYLSSIKG